MARRVYKVEPFLSELAFTEKAFFEYLRTLTSYAHANSETESSIYGAIGFILTVFCSSATIDGGSIKNLQLSSFPQKNLKANKRYRAPDFAALVTQFREFGQTFSGETMGQTSILTWEVKLQKDSSMPWFSPRWTRKNPRLFHIFPDFIAHLPQIVEQAAFARFQCGSKSVFTLLSVDIWFAFFHFPGDQSARFLEQFITDNGEPTKAPLDYSDYCKLLDCCVIAPSPMFKNRCRGFQPEFLHVLDRFATSLAAEVKVTIHSMFRLREGSVLESDSKNSMEFFKEAVLVRADQLRRDNALALGTEPSDAGTPQTSFPEDSDTGSDRYPAARPSHLTPGGVQTRSKSRAHATEEILRSNADEPLQPAASKATTAMTSGSRSGHHGRDHITNTVRAEGSSRPRRLLNAQSGGSS